MPERNLFDVAAELIWADYTHNPLIRPFFPTPLIADPTFLPPNKTPDKKWHLFAHSLMGVHHYVSEDGKRWVRFRKLVVSRSMRPFLFVQSGIYYLFYERFLSYLPQRSRIEVRCSRDLCHWSAPKIVLCPSLSWQGRTCGNPCVIKDEGEYRLYYSAGLVFLRDCKFSEPLFVGVATAKKITGVYKTAKDPVIAPDKKDAYRNHGAGSIKVVRSEAQYTGFHNGIYRDRDGRSRSAIRILYSEDGVAWQGFDRKPFLKPGGESWKRAFVYACDVRQWRGKVYVYYNARSGWLIGKESIGLCAGVRRKR